MSKNAENIIYNLEQIEHLSDSRISRYLKRLKDLGEDVEWHCARLSGFGGSESGALLRHSYGAFFDATGDSFRSAQEIISEKLLSQLPRRSSPQAERGTDIEALTRAVFRRKYKARVCEAGFNATKSHASISCMNGNIDDSVEANSKPILVDYKSSQHEYQEKPFDYVVQQNHYEAIARSNGFSFSKGLIVGLHASEQVLQSLAKISKCRHEDPENFEFWVDTLSTRGMPGVTLKLYPMSFDDNLIAVIEKTLPYMWKTNVLKGKLLVQQTISRLPEETIASLDKMMGETSHLLAIRSALDAKLEAQNKTLNSLLIGVDHKKLKFTEKHPIEISARTSLDSESAISALQAADVDIDSIKAKGKSRDPKKVEAAYKALGGDLESESLLKEDLPVKTIRAKLIEKDIDPSIYESKSFTFANSRKKKKSAAFEEDIEYWDGSIQRIVEQASIHSPIDCSPT